MRAITQVGILTLVAVLGTASSSAQSPSPTSQTLQTIGKLSVDLQKLPKPWLVDDPSILERGGAIAERTQGRGAGFVRFRARSTTLGVKHSKWLMDTTRLWPHQEYVMVEMQAEHPPAGANYFFNNSRNDDPLTSPQARQKAIARGILSENKNIHVRNNRWNLKVYTNPYESSEPHKVYYVSERNNIYCQDNFPSNYLNSDAEKHNPIMSCGIYIKKYSIYIGITASSLARDDITILIDEALRVASLTTDARDLLSLGEA